MQQPLLRLFIEKIKILYWLLYWIKNHECQKIDDTKIVIIINDTIYFAAQIKIFIFFYIVDLHL
jgi:hypothetical protein